MTNKLLYCIPGFHQLLKLLQQTMFPEYYNNSCVQSSTKPGGGHVSNCIRQNEVNMADEPFEVEEPLLESSSEIDKLVYDQYQIFPRHQKLWTNFPAQVI